MNTNFTLQSNIKSEKKLYDNDNNKNTNGIRYFNNNQDLNEPEKSSCDPQYNEFFNTVTNTWTPNIQKFTKKAKLIATLIEYIKQLASIEKNSDKQHLFSVINYHDIDDCILYRDKPDNKLLLQKLENILSELSIINDPEYNELLQQIQLALSNNDYIKAKSFADKINSKINLQIINYQFKQLLQLFEKFRFDSILGSSAKQYVNAAFSFIDKLEKNPKIQLFVAQRILDAALKNSESIQHLGTFEFIERLSKFILHLENK